MKYLILVTLLTMSFPNWVKANTDFGFDFNIPGAFTGISNERKYISGTLTAAKNSSQYEFAIPFFFNDFTHNPEVCCSIDIRRADLQLRSYRNNSRQGRYLGLLLRRSSVTGKDYSDNSQTVSYSRYGVGAVLGFKSEITKKIFWGANVNLGYFLSDGDLLASGDNTAIIFEPTDNGANLFFNIEFLKLGIRF